MTKVIDDFTGAEETTEHFEIVDLQRTRDLDLDLQVKWLASYIEALDEEPMISIDATRELGTALALKNALPNHRIYKIIWSGGSAITKDGSKYIASKVQSLMDLKAFIAIKRLTVADIPLRDELVNELQGFSFEEASGGGFTIKSGAQHDDLAMAVLAGLIPPLARGILERKPARAIPSLNTGGPGVYYEGVQPGNGMRP
jgi:thermostable 8-oxoguanine DNA glycosylase